MVGVDKSYAAMISGVSNKSNFSKDSVNVSQWEIFCWSMQSDWFT